MFPSNQLNNERTSCASHFLKRTLQRFASKTLQSDSKAVEKFQHLRFRAASFLIGLLANVQQRLNSQSNRLLKAYLQTQVGKWLKIHRKISKTFSMSFHLRLENSIKQKLPLGPDDETRSEARFLRNLPNLWSKVSRL